ncbi:MAG: hybrid sensor histidine kinase/response regulator, partial [Microcystis panniformis WG22]|nr:hybrid sensor histidine kinase/response regulator [Microcystis panniformis WG22]
MFNLIITTYLLNSLSYKITGMTQLTPRSSVLIVDDLPNNVRLLSI